MPRFYLPPDCWERDPALTGDEAAHAARVMRVKEGDEVQVFDGCGRISPATVVSASKSRVDLKLGAVSEEAPPKVPVTLAVAVIKGKAMDFLIQKAIELGVSVIQPLITERTVVKREAGGEAKWQRAVLEACKQSGVNRMPVVKPIQAFNDYAFSIKDESGLRIVASLMEESITLRQALEGAGEPKGVTFLIGPEGDFTNAELSQALEVGFQPVTLGSRILRAETAAIFCAVVAGYLF